MSDSPTCEACGAGIIRNTKWSRAYFATRRFCNKSCESAGRPEIATDYIVVGDCWEWQGTLDANGYGKAYDGSRPVGKRLDWAHRVSYRRHRGEIPAGHELDHECENTRCINPDHLCPVTRAEHIRRTVERAGGYARQAEAARLRRMGLTFAEIAEAAGLMNRSAAQSRVKEAIRNGLVRAEDVPPVRLMTPEEREDATLLYELGVPQGELAAWYRIDSSQISRIVNGKTGRNPESAVAS